LKVEKDKASKSYFEQLIAGGGNPQPNGQPNSGGAAAGPLSPIESVFQKHMQKSLLAYEEYYQVRFTCAIGIFWFQCRL